MGIDLVEVKSGNDFKTHSALDKIRKVAGWKFRESTVFCKGNVVTDDGVRYYPWYMVMFVNAYQPPVEMKYEIDLSALQ